MRKISANVIVDETPQFVISIEGGANIRTPIKLRLPDNIDSECDDIPSVVDKILSKHNLEPMSEDEKRYVLLGNSYGD